MKELKPKKIQLDYERVTFDDYDDTSLADLAKNFADLAKKYPTARVTTDIDYDNNNHSYRIYENRMETDEEFAKRKSKWEEELLQKEIRKATKIQKAEVDKEQKKQQKIAEEKKLYEKLKKKYGDK